MMKILKVVNKDKKYLDKQGKERLQVNYYIELDNGKWLPIRTINAQCYVVLEAVAYTIIKGGSEDESEKTK